MPRRPMKAWLRKRLQQNAPPMKIATYNDGSRDGQLVVVSRDLTTAHYAAGVASRLQQVLDDWNFLSPQLEELSQTLNHGKARHAFAFDPRMCLAPLPRVFHFASAVLGQQSPDDGPMMRVRRSDQLLGACEPVPRIDAFRNDDDHPIRLQLAAQLSAITGDLSSGGAADDSLAAVRLLTASVMWYPMSDQPVRDDAIVASFAPVAITPDELGLRWHDGLLDQFRLEILINGQRMQFDEVEHPDTRPIGSCLAECAALRGLRAGSIVATTIHGGANICFASGDSVRVAFSAPDGDSVFGVISTTFETRP